MCLKNPKTLRICEENLQPQMPELPFLKRYCNPEKSFNFIFSTETPSKYMTFLKNPQVKITSKSRFVSLFVFLTVTPSLTNYQKGGKFLV